MRNVEELDHFDDIMQLVVRIPEENRSGSSLAIIEMQGELESRAGDVEMAGKLIGDLSFSKDGSNTPMLIIGHHILYGKIVNLDNPMVVMHKKSQTESEGTSDETTSYSVQSIIRKKILFKTRPKPIIANVPKKL